MELNEDLATADQDLELSYDMMKRAIDREDNLTDYAREKMNGMYDEVQQELDSYRDHLVQISSALKEGELEEIDVMEDLTDAGQHLANAYHEARVLYNKGESVLQDGDQAFESDITSTSIDDVSDEIGLVNKAVGLKEEAFEQYDEALQEVASEAVDAYMEEGMVANVDVGLGQQTPEQLR